MGEEARDYDREPIKCAYTAYTRYAHVSEGVRVNMWICANVKHHWTTSHLFPSNTLRIGRVKRSFYSPNSRDSIYSYTPPLYRWNVKDKTGGQLFPLTRDRAPSYAHAVRTHEQCSNPLKTKEKTLYLQASLPGRPSSPALILFTARPARYY